jgi:hypothetical protein
MRDLAAYATRRTDDEGCSLRSAVRIDRVHDNSLRWVGVEYANPPSQWNCILTLF